MRSPLSKVTIIVWQSNSVTVRKIMVQITEQEIIALRELINSRFDLTDQKIDSLKERIERLEKSNDKILTAVIIAFLSVLIAGLVKWILPVSNTI